MTTSEIAYKLHPDRLIASWLKGSLEMKWRHRNGYVLNLLIY